MAQIARLLVFMALAMFLLPPLGAQDKDKKDPAKAEKDGKKDAGKKKDDQDKGKPKVEPKKDKGEPEEKLVYGHVITAKLSRMDQNSARDFSIQVPEIDPEKVQRVNRWKLERTLAINQMPVRNRDELVAKQNALAQFQLELSRQNVYSMKDVNLRAAENCRVRSLLLPLEFDDRGFVKKWTPKEIAALKGNSKLKGYPADFDRLVAGQLVELYMAKQEKSGPMGKGKKILDEEVVNRRPEVVMIVIVAEAQKQ